MTAPTSVLSKELLPASIAIFTTVALAAFEGLAVAAALPEVAADLGGVAQLPWVITSFLLVSGVATVAAGPLIDAIGVSRMFKVAVVVFTIGGMAAGLVPSMSLMIAARIVQGAGAGLVVATGLAGVSLVYPEHLVGRAFAANATVWGVMGVGAPAIAAFMLTTWSWRWIFLINLPLGLVALFAGWTALPGPLPGARRRRIDGVGLAMVLVFTTALLLAVDALGPISIAWLALAAVAAAWYWRHARTSDEPVIKRRHLATRPFGSLGVSVALLLTGAMSAASFVPLYVQGGRGAGPSLTAWSVLFFTLGWTLGANASSRLMDRYAETSVMMAGMATTIPALAVLSVAVGTNLALPVAFALLLMVGIGIGSTTNAALTLLRAMSASEEIGRATAAHQFYRNLGFTMGAAIGGAVILFVVASAVGDVEVVRDLLAGTAESTVRDVDVAISDGFAAAAGAGAVIAGLAVVPFIDLRRHLASARAAARQ